MNACVSTALPLAVFIFSIYVPDALPPASYWLVGRQCVYVRLSLAAAASFFSLHKRLCVPLPLAVFSY
jgi:hypothetical protein